MICGEPCDASVEGEVCVRPMGHIGALLNTARVHVTKSGIAWTHPNHFGGDRVLAKRALDAMSETIAMHKPFLSLNATRRTPPKSRKSNHA